jgi:hypothetical protein
MNDRNSLRRRATQELADLDTYTRLRKVGRDLGIEDSPAIVRAISDSQQRLRIIEDQLDREE